MRACLPLFCAGLTTQSLPYITLCRRAEGELTKLPLNRVTFWERNVNKNQNVIEELTDQRKQITWDICSKSDGKVGNLRKAGAVSRPEARGGVGWGQLQKRRNSSFLPFLAGSLCSFWNLPAVQIWKLPGSFLPTQPELPGPTFQEELEFEQTNFTQCTPAPLQCCLGPVTHLWNCRNYSCHCDPPNPGKAHHWPSGSETIPWGAWRSDLQNPILALGTSHCLCQRLSPSLVSPSPFSSSNLIRKAKWETIFFPHLSHCN